MNVFVERKLGVIVSLYANRQLGIAEEELPDNNAEVVAFKNPPPITNAQRIAALMGQPGAVSRAVALVMLDEINTIRTHAAIGLAPRTPAQLLTALETKLGA